MDQEIYTQMRVVEDAHWWFNGRKRIVAQMIESLHLPKGARLLDAGCGTGGNLQLLARYGSVKGLEYDENAIRLARTRGVGEIMQAAFPDKIPLVGETFNLVVLLDVLEHIEDDVATLRALGGLLDPEGKLLLTVPAFPFLWCKHDDLHHHKRRYTARTLTQAIEAAGLKVQYLSYFNMWLFPLVAAVRVVQKWFPPKDCDGELTVPPRFANAFLEWLFGSERFLLGRVKLPFGVSLLAVVQKGEQR